MSKGATDEIKKRKQAYAAMTPEERKEYNEKVLQRWQAGLGLAFNWLAKPTYSGTVDPVVIENRRARNRRAKKSRRINRLRSK